MKRILMIVLFGLMILSCSEKNNESNVKSLLVQQLKNSHTNQEWFVPTKKAIDGLTLEQSNWKDGTDNHSIGELVSHLIFYNELVLKAFKGENYTDINNDEENKETFKLYEGKEWQML